MKIAIADAGISGLYRAWMLYKQHDQLHFDAMLSLRRELLTQKNLAIHLAKQPWMTFKVTAAIYYQALRLWLKKIPFYAHP